MRLTNCSYIFALAAVPGSLLAGSISVQPILFNTPQGQNFTLTVNATGISDLYGYQFDIGFNPSILSATSLTEGSLLPSGGSTSFIPGVIDNAAGTVTFNAGILNGAAFGVSGSGPLVTFQFMALAAGSSSVQLFNVTALNSFGEGLTFSTSGATVNVTASSAPEPATLLLFSSSLAIVMLGPRSLFERMSRSRSTRMI